MSTALPVTKRVAALREPAKRKRSRELAGLGLDGTKGIEEPAKQLPYFIPEEQQGKANRPVCREPGGIKWKELRPVRCKVPVPEGEDERKEKFFVSGFDTVDVLVSNPGEPARYEPALVLDQREGPDDTIYLMVAYWWKRDAVRKALSGFKKYLDRKWPKNEPWQWMLGMYFDVITSDYVHDKVAVDGKFCKTLFFGHIPYNFEIFDREASDESSRQEFIKQKLGTEADRDAMETAMRKLWLLIGPALEDQPEEEGFDEDDIEDPVPIKTDVSEHVGSSISEEVETSNDLPDNGNNDSDSSSVGSTFVVQSKSEKPAAVQDDEKDGPPQLDGNADKKENIKPVAGPIQTPSGTIFINKTVPFSSSYSAAVSREPSWLAEVPKLTKDQQQQLEAVMASIKRLVKMRSVVDQWCKYDLEEPVFEHLKRMIADDPEIDKETFK